MDELSVSYDGGIGFTVAARGHRVKIDLPVNKGGRDEGITPPEAFMASLGSCIGVYVARYCENAKLDTSGMRVVMTWNLSEDKTKIVDIKAKISLPKAQVGQRAKAVLEAARRCLVHNTILSMPHIDLSLDAI